MNSHGRTGQVKLHLNEEINRGIPGEDDTATILQRWNMRRKKIMTSEMTWLSCMMWQDMIAETCPMRWIACMFREVLLVGCFNLDSIKDMLVNMANGIMRELLLHQRRLIWLNL
jgi:hypothetical protein